jgi:hypothetical protein
VEIAYHRENEGRAFQRVQMLSFRAGFHRMVGIIKHVAANAIKISSV